ncbi:MAG: 4-(cytidine 5'-diphospho)-2-C-methyl-D-erythritol kinase [Candidatus Omnitrophota bacterium]
MKRSHPPLLLHSFAKLNLYLRVLNKRRDNFHNLNTLFARIDLADTIILKERKDNTIKIKCNSRQVPKDKANLCYRAAALLKQEYKLQNNGLPSFRPQGHGLASCGQSHKQSHKLSFGLEIEIKKRIPVGAGLGGGSSNAASVLLGLNKYWGLNLSKTKLVKLAAKLGSDVAFFVYDTKFALGSRRGEKIKPLASLERLKLWFILVYPGIKVSTPLVYRRFDHFRQAGSKFSQLTIPRHDVKILISELLKRGHRASSEFLFNSLEVVTAGLYPVVNQVKKALYGTGLEKVMMSGSGPAVFAICGSQKQAQDLSGRLRKKYKSWQVFVSSTV